MDKKPDIAPEEKKPKGDELVFPLIALGFAFYYFYTIKDLSWEAQINGVMIGSVLVFLIAVFFLKTFLERRRGKISFQFKAFVFKSSSQWTRVWFFLLAIAYVIVVPRAGFTLTTFSYLVAAMVLLGVRAPLRIFTISAALSVSGYLFFITLLKTRLPSGPIERLLGWLF